MTTKIHTEVDVRFVLPPGDIEVGSSISGAKNLMIELENWVNNYLNKNRTDGVVVSHISSKDIVEPMGYDSEGDEIPGLVPFDYDISQLQ